MKFVGVSVLAAAGIAVLVTGCSSPGASTSVPSTSQSATSVPSTSQSASSVPGRFVTLADYQAESGAAHSRGAVVLFFTASWCPSCQAAEQSLETEGVPADLTVVKVDYDSEQELRRTYGVRVQHTFVQVNAKGEAVATWAGSSTGADIRSNVRPSPV